MTSITSITGEAPKTVKALAKYSSKVDSGQDDVKYNLASATNHPLLKDVFTEKVFNVNDALAGSPPVFTCPSTGYYEVTAEWRVKSNSTAAGHTLGNIFFTMNDGIDYSTAHDEVVYYVYKTPDTKTDWHPVHFTGILKCEAGDTISMWIRYGSGDWFWHKTSKVTIREI